MNLSQFPKYFFRKSLNHFGYDIGKMPIRQIAIQTDYKRVSHLLYLNKLFALISSVQGDIVECGVGRGYSFFELCCLTMFENKGRTVYGFDSFEGFPEPSDEDKSPRNAQKGQWHVATMEKVLAQLQSRKIEKSFIDNNVKLIMGFFENSLQQYSGSTVAFLHLDVDLYKSYKVTLEYFWPKVAIGGVVAFDEYMQPSALRNWPGASKAIDEFFGDLRSRIRFNEQAGKYYIVKNQ